MPFPPQSTPETPALLLGAMGLILLGLACSGGPETPRKDAAPSAIQAPQHHCRTDTGVRFACSFADGRILNICEMETGLSVRLGPAGEIAFKYPPNNTASDFTFDKRPAGENAYQGLTFTWEAKEYALRELSYEGKTEEAGLIVSNAKGKILPGGGTCTGQVTRNWEAIERMHNFEFSDGPP